jgi:hypothetical protein
MLFYEFIDKTNKYLRSVRVLKNYVSFDMIFPDGWVLLKKNPENIEVIKNETNEGLVTSFVCEMKKDFIEVLEETLDYIVKTNIEREEKERLFKTKVNELKNIFEKEKLDSLKSLKFDIEDFTKFIENGTEIKDEKSEEGVRST